MGFIDFEAKVAQDNELLSFSDDESNDEGPSNFIDDDYDVGEERSFYRKFVNQARDPAEEVLDDDGSHFSTRDLQPEMFDRENRDEVAFDNFDDYGKCADQFKKSLVSFKDGDV